MASLLLRGLEVESPWLSLHPSPPRRDSAWLMGPAESRFSDILLLRSRLFLSTGLLLFSWPPAVQVVKTGGAVFPLSGPWLRARFIGLFGDVRREAGLTGAVLERPDERSASFALGGNGTASGEGV